MKHHNLITPLRSAKSDESTPRSVLGKGDFLEFEEGVMTDDLQRMINVGSIDLLRAGND